MSSGSWRSVFCSVLFCLLLMLLDRRTDATLEGSSMGYLGLPYSKEPAVFPRILSVSEVKVSHGGDGVVSRRKRNIFYQSGLKLCGQETTEQVVASHLSYFHLRVCQETIWEAFKIFWDRLPEQEEYQSWMSRCLEGSTTARDIGSYFSESEEHQSRVKNKTSQEDLKSQPTRPWHHMCSTPTPVTPEAARSPVPDIGKGTEEENAAAVSTDAEESPLLNDITVQPTTATALEQVVEMSILLTGEVFSDDLNDPNSLQFQTLSRHLVEKIEESLEELPGFKSVSVMDFRPQRDTHGTDGVVADYTVTVLVDGEGVSSDQLNYLTLQSNRVENSYRGLKERSTVVYSKVTDDFTEAFHVGKLETVSEVPSSVSSADETTVSTVNDLPKVSNVEEDAGDGVLTLEEDAGDDVLTLKEDAGDDVLTPEEDAGDDVLTLEEDAGDDVLTPEEDTGDDVLTPEEDTGDDILTPEEDTGDDILTPEEDTGDDILTLEEDTGDDVLTPEEGAGDDILTPEEDAGDDILTPEEDSVDDVLPQSSETNTVPTTGSDIVVLEESEVVTPAVVFITSTPEVGSLQDEGLLLEEIPASETPPLEDLPPEPPSIELPVIDTLPEPPVETEASGSGLHDVDILVEPSTTTMEETGPEEEVTIQEISIAADAATEAVEGEELAPAILEDQHLDEVVVDEVESPEDQEVSTIVTETMAEEPPPALDVGLMSETSETTAQLPEADDLIDETPKESHFTEAPPVSEVINHNPEEDVSAVLTHTEHPMFGEEDVESDGEEVKEETPPETPVLEAEAPQEHEISAEDLTEDEILPVDKNNPEPLVTNSPGPPPPTAFSPEKESPFTLISVIGPDSDSEEPDTDITSLEEIQTPHEGLEDATAGDEGYGVVSFGFGLTNQTEEGSTGFPFGVAHGTDQASIAMPVNPGRALIVFFSLRVTNMVFSEDLFNKSSPEYKALEQRFLELLVPYLQSNLSHFENLEILNFRNGSIVVNSRMKFGKPVAHGVTTTVYLILEDFCNTAYQTMNLAIDKYSLDVESGDQADPCKFQACNEYAECKVNKWSGEAECVCNAGYFSVDGLPCQSICELQTDFCLNDGKCDIIPGQGAICRCRVGENWWYRGEHCEEYVSEPLVVGIAIASVAGFLLVASGVLFFLARTLRDQYDKDESEDPIRRAESLPSLERATKYNPMYESEATTGYSHYYRRYPEPPVYSSASAEASTDFSSEEIRHIYENSELTKEEIQDRIRIIELYAKDRQFADFVRQHQAVLDTRRESSTTET